MLLGQAGRVSPGPIPVRRARWWPAARRRTPRPRRSRRRGPAAASQARSAASVAPRQRALGQHQVGHAVRPRPSAPPSTAAAAGRCRLMPATLRGQGRRPAGQHARGHPGGQHAYGHHGEQPPSRPAEVGQPAAGSPLPARRTGCRCVDRDNHGRPGLGDGGIATARPRRRPRPSASDDAQRRTAPGPRQHHDRGGCAAHRVQPGQPQPGLGGPATAAVRLPARTVHLGGGHGGCRPGCAGPRRGQVAGRPGRAG